MRPSRPLIFAAAAICLATLLGGVLLGPAIRAHVRAWTGRATVAERVKEVEERVMPIWAGRHADPLGIESLTLLVLKQERELVVYARGAPGGMDGGGTLDALRPRLIATYTILAASGSAGPKLREGDRQVPEGVYSITFLNPNSRYRLSMRLGYPSEEDVAAARADGRDPHTLGGDIMIHGSDQSVGCVAIGDPAIEEVFWLVASVGIDKTRVVIVPSRAPLTHLNEQMPKWLAERYTRLDAAVRELVE